MKYQTYPAYKDSGVEWLGNVPEHWKIASLSKLFNIKAGGDLKTEFFSEIETENHPYPIYTNANDEKAIYGYTSKSNYSANTITVSGRGEVGFAAYRDHAYDAIIRLLVLSAIGDSHCKFFTYFINAVIDFRVESSAIGQLSTQQISPYKVTFPAFSEQQKIAQFLDHETAKIDTLIEKQQRLIELLKEKRQAVISHAVTKGLNPNAPMKDSGVEWLGEVPEHWETGSLRWFISIASGDGLSNSEFEKEKDEQFKYRVIGGNGTLGYSANVNTTTKTFAIGRVGALCGNVHFVNEHCWITDNALKLYSWRKFEESYLYFLLTAARLNEYANKNAQPLITGEQVKSLNVVIPSINEQIEIAEYIETTITKIDVLTEKANSAIELMQERRNALISAAVTGKIDVRNWGDL